MKKIVLPSLLALGLNFGAQAQKLNPTEQKIAQYIDAHFAQTEQLLKDAVQLGYTKMKLDTLEKLQPAIRLYQQIGFMESTAYYTNPLDGVVYMEKSLV